MSAMICGEGASIRFVPSGRLDSSAVGSLRDALQALGTNALGDVTIDFSEISFIDGAGVAAVAFLYRRLAGKSLRLFVVGVTGQPLEVFHQLGLGAQFGLLPVAGQPAKPSRSWGQRLSGLAGA